MSNQVNSNRAAMNFEDDAFHHRSTFDFDDDMQGMGTHMTAFDTFHGSHMNFGLEDGLDEHPENFDMEFFHGQLDSEFHVNQSTRNSQMAGIGMADPSSKHARSHRTSAKSAVAPTSGLGEIVSSRNELVSEQYGQITPPDELVEQPFPAPSAKAQSTGKLSNEQRARNAANSRHSRSKNAKAKQTEESGESDLDASQKQAKNLIVQREKNRVAAAKCRAKKKSANEQQEEMANHHSTNNTFLTREIRELKNQKTELQNYLLAHRPGVCECHGIHDYNLGQAQRLVLKARRQTEPMPPSPSVESMYSSNSQDSDVAGMMFSGMNTAGPSEAMAMHYRSQSFNTPAGYMHSQINHSDAMVARRDVGGEHQDMSRDFAEFLHSSPNTRATFS